MRLSRGREFRAVYDAKVRASVGPLAVSGRPNQRSHPRLGLAVSRRVGPAITRNAIKRRLREAFRLLQHDGPPSAHGYDLVIAVRAHTPLTTAEYQAAIRQALSKIHSTWTRKLQKTPRPSNGGTTAG
ncbi:MAG: ribonuclease P protein component [Phycisphaerales bacterium]|nr:ribonuclease P protein component [Phycisphaerales bacterium]MCI0629934.1 ribonuclease P protein component [Phycisphaerales bacterium]MCI0674902.1 ribonuclease P protein component [Phycisphaerales bacterium]